MRNSVDVLGVQVDKVTMQGAVQKVETFVSEDRVHSIYTPNAEIMMAAQRDSGLKDILNAADMLVADGAGIILASKILGLGLPEKVSGIDLVKNIFPVSKEKGYKFFFFGSKPGVAAAAGEKMVSTYPGVEIVGYRDGYFSPADEDGIIEEINSSGANIVLVALGAPKQEKWIHANKSRLKARVCIGVGGSLDVYAGQVKLAPELLRRMGLEWLYRLYREPWRYKRMLDLPRFVLRVLAVKLGLK